MMLPGLGFPKRPANMSDAEWGKCLTNWSKADAKRTRVAIAMLIIGTVCALAALIMIFTIGARAQDKKPDPPKPAHEVPVPESAQPKLLKSQHKIDAIKQQMSDVQAGWLSSQAYQQLVQVQKQYQELQGKLNGAQAELEKEVNETAKAAGCPECENKVEFDGENSKLVPKREPVPAEKKQ